MLTIPYLLGSQKHLRVYLPMIDLIANVFSNSGSHDNNIFKDLYKLSPNNVISFLSTNFINLVALSGVALNGTAIFKATGDQWISIKVMLVMYTITYLLPTQGIYWVVKTIQSHIDAFRFNNTRHPYLNTIKRFIKRHPLWFDYLGGFITVTILVVFEAVIINLYLKWVHMK